MDVETTDDGKHIARLWRVDADDEPPRPMGDSLGRRPLTKKEMAALEDGDVIADFEGFKVQPDDEVGGDDGSGSGSGDGSAAAGASTSATALKATAAAKRPWGGGGARYATAGKPPTGAAFRLPAMAPFKPPPRAPPKPSPPSPSSERASKTQKTDAAGAPGRKFIDAEEAARIEAQFAALIPKLLPGRVAGGGGGGFDDLYAEHFEENPEDARRAAKRRATAADEDATAPVVNVVPLAKRKSKWAAYDHTDASAAATTAAAAAAETPRDDPIVIDPPEPAAAAGAGAGGGSGGSNGLGGLAALIKSGGGGLSGLTAGIKAQPPAAAAAPSAARGDWRDAGAGDVDDASADIAVMRRWGPGGDGENDAKAVPPPAAASRAFNPPAQRPRADAPRVGVANVAPGPGGVKPEDGLALKLDLPSRDRSSRTRAGASTVANGAFPTTTAYQAHFCGAIRDDLRARLAAAREGLDAAAARCGGGDAARARGAAGASVSAKAIAHELRSSSSDVEYYSDCSLRFDTYKPFKDWSRGGKKNWGKNKNRDDDDDDDDEPKPATESKTWLTLNDPSERRKGYSKCDVWVLSNTPTFHVPVLSEVGPGDRNRAPWTIVAKAAWHGPDNTGKMEIKLLGDKPRHGMRDKQPVYAIRAFNASTAIAEHENIAIATPETFPLWPHVLGSKLVDDAASQDAILADAVGLKARHGLNDDQAGAVAGALLVAAEAGRRVPRDALTVSPVRLIHGPFGSGKTHALASFIISAAERLRAAKSPARILISAHTNVAVDRVLTTLMTRGFTEFVRVGSLRKIDHAVLPHSLHCKEGKKRATGGGGEDEGGNSRGKGAAHLAELRAMIKDATTARERAFLSKELQAAKDGVADRRAGFLRKCRVVGVTTASCGNSVMNGMTFSVCVLDECSQMTEPSSLMAMSRFGCRALVAVGDPKQLPPTLDSDRGGGGGGGGGALDDATRNPLAVGLFSRLASAGHVPTLLRTQYRLHPALSSIPNALFYDGKLLDGCDAAARAGVLAVAAGEGETRQSTDRDIADAPPTTLPPLMWIDVTSGDERVEPGSYSKYSPKEARVAATIAATVAGALGTSPEDVGVIATYKAQSTRIRQELGRALDRARRAGGPSACANPDSVCDAVAAPEPETEPDDAEVHVATVDAFQGQEKEVVILSLCGGGASSACAPHGFLTDERVNVALTRARRHLIILGDSKLEAVRAHRAWSACLLAARRLPNGYSPGQRTATDAATRSMLSAWRRVERVVDPAAKAEEGGEDADDGKTSGGGGGARDDDADADDDTDAETPDAASDRGHAYEDEEEEEDDEEEEEEEEEEEDDALADASFVDLRTPPATGTTREDEEEGELEASEEEDAASPPLELEHLPESRHAFHAALASPSVDLSAEDYWRAYAGINRGILYGDEPSRRAVEASKLGRCVVRHFDLPRASGPDGGGGEIDWTSAATRKAMLKDVLPGMKTYVQMMHGHKWTRLSRLIDRFDDREALAREVGGFGRHVVSDAKTQASDEAGAAFFSERGDASEYVPRRRLEVE